MFSQYAARPALANVPPTWGLQLMVRRDFFENELIDYHRGLKRKLSEGKNPRIVVNILPENIAKLKPKDVLKHAWVWEHVLGERIVIFHGTGTLCSNTYKSWEDLEPYAYVGLPWGKLGGQGGWGTEISYRRKSAMMDFHQMIGGDLKVGGPGEDTMIRTLLKKNAELGYDKYNIAPAHVVEWMGGTSIEFPNKTLNDEALKTFGPLVVVGTLPHLSDAGRNWVLGTCPEIKAVFPVLHNPGCFGAKPNEAQCAESLGFKPPCEDKAS